MSVEERVVCYSYRGFHEKGTPSYLPGRSGIDIVVIEGVYTERTFFMN